jgi:hypothetical protein
MSIEQLVAFLHAQFLSLRIGLADAQFFAEDLRRLVGS